MSDFKSEQYKPEDSGNTSEIAKDPRPPEEGDSADAIFEDNLISISDSMYIYKAEFNRIIITRTDNANTGENIAIIETFNEIINLLKSQNILVVIQRITDSKNSTGFNSNIQTGVLFIDVSNPYEPEKLKEIQIDGQIMDNILINKRLYLIQQFKADIDLQADERNMQENQEEVKQEIETFPIDRFMPYYAYMDDLRQPLGFIRLVEPDDLFRPAVPSGSTMTIVSLLNIKYMFDLPQSIGFIGDIENISKNSTTLYLNESTGNTYEIDISGEKPVFTDFANTI